MSERDEGTEDKEQIKQKELGEREHHERMEQLQMGDLNAETSLAMSKAEKPPDPPPETRGMVGDEPLMPRILESPNTQHRKL